jgi:hypothetical protein
MEEGGGEREESNGGQSAEAWETDKGGGERLLACSTRRAY